MALANESSSDFVGKAVEETRDHRDDLLQALVTVPEKTNIEIGITLNVKGLLITGFIISQATYFEQLTEGIRGTKGDAETRSILGDFLSDLKAPLLKKAEKSGKDFPRFIHLRNVKIYPSEGRGMPTFGHALWRGNLESIDGFSLGEMVPASFDSITKRMS